MNRPPLSASRAVAAEVLSRVFSSAAFASIALDHAVSRAELDARDAALATELVYGVLRVEGFLLESLTRAAGRDRIEVDDLVRAHLLMGAYTLAFLDRVPSFAAVSEAVAGVRAASGDRAGGFANAVLRRLAEEWSKSRPRLADAVVLSAPAWLKGALRHALGRSASHAFLVASAATPPAGICLRDPARREELLAVLRAAQPDAEFEPGRASRHAILARGAGDPRRLPGYGVDWIPMEEGAQALVLAANPSSSDSVLDACAGHGNKTWLLGQILGPGGSIDASDLDANKLADLKRGPAGSVVRAVAPIDWTVASDALGRSYDLALVDAPCSGIGTLRRRPEIARTRTPEDVARLADLQVGIALGAATRVRDGGRLVVAVCSVLREECEDVVERLLAAESASSPPFRLERGEPAPRRFLPQVDGTDGYFVAGFVVRRRQS